jgi:uncharacterized protein
MDKTELFTKVTQDISTDKFTYKNFIITFFYIFTVQFAISFLPPTYDYYTGSQITIFLLSGPYYGLIEACFILIFLLIYKPAQLFIKNIFYISPLKKLKTYIYIGTGFLSIIIFQYISINYLQFEGHSEPDIYNMNIFNLLVSLIVISIITPVKEEIIYRGILFKFFTGRYNVIVGIIISSAIFGLLHSGYPITAGIMGVIFALLFYKTKSVLPAIFLHSMWNLFVLIMS